MHMTLEEFQKIMEHHDPIIGAEDAFAFVYAVMIAEAAMMEKMEPYAVNSIERLRQAAEEVYSMQTEIEAGEFLDSMED